ncbi:MAG: hypothetical protein MI810_00200 [Flavobacteriales bacterium]|nr:hypothetical protein [Flavobacteriales bacterium]
MKHLAVLSVVFLFIACSGEQQEQEVIAMEDLMGGVGEETIDSVSAGTDDTVIEDSELGYFVHSQSSQYDTTSHDEYSQMDRFSFSTREKIVFEGKETVPYGDNLDVTPRAWFYHYTFSDSAKTNNAFYNFLDDVSENGESEPVRIYEDMEALKTPPLHYIVYDTSIVFIKYTCEAEKNDWKSFEDSLINYYGSEYRYRFDVECGGPLKWLD